MAGVQQNLPETCVTLEEQNRGKFLNAEHDMSGKNLVSRQKWLTKAKNALMVVGYVLLKPSEIKLWNGF